MKKQIIIVGGGISGLSLLHYLNLKYAARPDLEIRLFEKNDYPGGTIRSVIKNGCIFETGPNGFLNSKPQTLKLVEELGLEDSLLAAREEAKIRYITYNGQLYALPTTPQSFLAFKLFNPIEKLRVLCEVFLPKGRNPQESVYEFGKRRLGRRFADLFLDPMVSGIYGGDARAINLKAAFPRIHQLEQEFGSLFKAMLALKKRKENASDNNLGMPKGGLTSFRKGMQQLIDTLSERYQNQINCRQTIKTVSYYQDQYIVYSQDKQYTADELYLCTPAYHASELMHSLTPSLSKELRSIRYSPIVVVGLVYVKAELGEIPKGFGYLVPSMENREILGVLFENNIFKLRCPEGQVMFRVMMGGARHPDILNLPENKIIEMAIEEIKSKFKTLGKPKEIFITSWKKAIPQYDHRYVDIKERVQNSFAEFKKLHIVANYWQGIALNDCIESAYQTAQHSVL